MAAPSTSIRWVKLAFGAMAAVFLVHAIVFFVHTAPGFLNSDAATEILLTRLTMEAKSPLVSNFYYVNGDYWIFGAQWFTIPIILLLGVSAKALYATNATSIAIEVAALTWAFRQLDRSWLHAAFASLVTLFAWSTVELLFEYVELSYAMIATMHFLVFVLYAKALRAPARRRDVGLALLTFFLLSVQNPQRAGAFALVPILAGCAWRWEPSVERRERLRIGAFTLGALAIAFLIHRFVLKSLVTPAVQAGMSLGLRGPTGILHNLGVLARAIVTLAAPRDDAPATALLGLPVLVGGVLWAIGYARRSRAYEPMRFVAIVLLAEVAFVLLLFIVGDMLPNVLAVRYVLPGLLPLLGLGSIAALRALEVPRHRRLALAWLCLLPLDALVATSRRVWGAREVYAEADPAKLQGVADELVRRDLRHGFATYWHANSITLLADGEAKTCGVAFRDGLVPRKWLVDTRCFQASLLPESIYVIAGPQEREAATKALAVAKFPAPRDQFEVEGFAVNVYRTADCPIEWLDLARPRL